MTEKAYNLVLYDKRIELKLSRKEASKKLGITRLSLFLYEKGYYVVPKKHYQKFIDLYKLPKDFFTANLLYPSPLNKDEKKQDKIESKFRKFATHTITKISLLAILAGLITCIPIGYLNLSNATSNITSYYSPQFQAIRKNVINNGKRSESLITKEPGYTSEKKYSSEEFGIECTVSYFFYEKEAKIKDWTTTAEFTSKSPKLNIYTRTAILYNGITVSVQIKVDGGNSLFVEFLHSENDYKLTKAYDSYGNDFKNSELLPDAEKAARSSLVIINNFFAEFNKEKIGHIYPEEYNFDQFCTDGIKGYSSYKSRFATSTIMFIVSSVLSAVVFLLLLGSIFLTKRKKETILGESLIDSTSIKNNSPPKKHKELKERNFFFPHIFFEPVARTIVVLFILFSSITFILFCSSIVQMGFNIMNINDGVVNSAKFLLQLRRFAGSLVCIATILHIFIKFDNFINYRNYVSSIIIFITIGLIFYVFETTIIYSAQRGLNNFSEIINTFSAYFPSNMFFGIAAYSLIAMFLFSAPKSIQDSKVKRTIWRSLVILPIGYLVFSIVYNILIKAYSYSKFPFFISLLLYPEAFITTLFVILYCIGIYIYRKALSIKYNKQNFETYLRGSKYILFKNIYAASIVLILGIIELVFRFGVAQTTTTGILKLGNNYLVLISIPILLFYRPHFGKRSTVADTTYIISYGCSYALAYILLLFIILPWINLFMPILSSIVSYLIG